MIRRTVRDVLRDKDITLSAEELQLVKSLIKGHLPSDTIEEFVWLYFNVYAHMYTAYC